MLAVSILKNPVQVIACTELMQTKFVYPFFIYSNLSAQPSKFEFVFAQNL